MPTTSKRLFAGDQTLESFKQLLQVFTDKLLFVEWILQVLRAVSIYFLNIKARIEADRFAEVNEDIDMRTAPSAVRSNIIHDEAVLAQRWDACLSCEFLTEGDSCTKCGCFMAVKHKIAHAACPVGKWGRHKEIHGITATT